MQSLFHSRFLSCNSKRTFCNIIFLFSFFSSFTRHTIFMLLRYISLLRSCYNCDVYVDDEKNVSSRHFYENSFEKKKMWNSEFIAINDFLLSIRRKKKRKNCLNFFTEVNIFSPSNFGDFQITL